MVMIKVNSLGSVYVYEYLCIECLSIYALKHYINP